MRFVVLKRSLRLNSFTLIELLTVIAIIAILAALTLAAAEGVMKSAARSRAKAEIQGLSTALESYKSDNGIYPSAYTFTGGASNYAAADPLTQTNFSGSAQLLYQALSGYANFRDTPVAGTKSYMSFKANQLGNATAAAGTSGAGSTYVQDPFGYPYGYYTGDTPVAGAPQQNPPYNGTGFFDLWSTGGNTTTTPNWTNSWISNWQQ